MAGAQESSWKMYQKVVQQLSKYNIVGYVKVMLLYCYM